MSSFFILTAANLRSQSSIRSFLLSSPCMVADCQHGGLAFSCCPVSSTCVRSTYISSAHLTKEHRKTLCVPGDPPINGFPACQAQRGIWQLKSLHGLLPVNRTLFYKSKCICVVCRVTSSKACPSFSLMGIPSVNNGTSVSPEDLQVQRLGSFITMRLGIRIELSRIEMSDLAK